MNTSSISSWLINPQARPWGTHRPWLPWPAAPGISTPHPCPPGWGQHWSPGLGSHSLSEKGCRCTCYQPWLLGGLPQTPASVLPPALPAAAPDWAPGTESWDGLQVWFCTSSCLCLSADPVTTTLLSPLTLSSVGWEDYTFTVEGNVSAKVLLGSYLIIPHGADQHFPGNLHHMDNNSDVMMPLSACVTGESTLPVTAMPGCNQEKEFLPGLVRAQPSDALWCQQWWGCVLPNLPACYEFFQASLLPHVHAFEHHFSLYHHS